MLSLCPDGGGRGTCSGSVFGVRAGRPFSCIYNYYYYISMGRFGRVYRLWASASSGAYRRVMQVAGSCDVYRIVFCPTLKSLNVRTYSARFSPSPFPAAILRLGYLYYQPCLCRSNLKWSVLTGTFLSSRYCRCRLPMGSSWGSGAGCVWVDRTCGTR